MTMTIRIVWGTALAAIFCCSGALGQTDLKRSAQQNSPAPPASKTRARRAVGTSSKPANTKLTGTAPARSTANSTTASIDAPAKSAAVNVEPISTKLPEKPSDKTTDKLPEKTSAPPVADPKTPKAADAVITLRDQIDAAPNGPERIRLQLKLVDQLVATDKKPEAIAELHIVTTSDVFDPQGFYNAGNALARLGDSEQAINAYHKAIEQRKGRYTRALNNLGVVLLREGRWEEAHQTLWSALKLESFHYAEASYNLGRLYAALGQPDLAIREWRRVLKIDPEHSGALQALGNAGGEGRILVASQPAPKGSTLAKEIKNAPDNTSLSTRTVGSDLTPTATTAKGLSVDPVSYGFLQRARSSHEHGNLQDAVENYQRVISRMGGYFPPANLELSYALITLKRNDEALANLLKVSDKDGDRYPISYYYAARLHELRGDLKLAEQSFIQAATAYGDKNNQFLLDLVRVRERQGNIKGALATLEEFLSSLEQQGRRPSWADERLNALRAKLAATQPK